MDTRHLFYTGDALCGWERRRCRDVYGLAGRRVDGGGIFMSPRLRELIGRTQVAGATLAADLRDLVHLCEGDRCSEHEARMRALALVIGVRQELTKVEAELLMNESEEDEAT